MSENNEINSLPHDLLAEKSLIGCLLVDGKTFDEVLDLGLDKEDFHHPKYGIIFDCLRDLNVENNPIDLVTVSSRLKETGMLDSIGGSHFVQELLEDQMSAANVYHYGKTVKDKANLRTIIRTASRLAERGKNYKGKMEDFVGEVEAEFFKITQDSRHDGMAELRSCLWSNLKELEDTSRVPGELTGLSTGYTGLDKYLLGLQAGQLVIIAARPGMGKTSLALNMAVNACRMAQLPIALFSLEMLGPELSFRILSSEAKVDSKRLRSKDLMDTDLRSIGKAVKDLSTLPIMINDNGDTTILEIQGHCRKIKAEQGLGLIVIDYLQLMRSHTKATSREQQISEISRGLKSMAKELGCPVVALSQLNRSADSRPDKRPNLSDLRESGAIEQDADIVLMIYRDEVYNKDSKEPGIAEVIVAKNRAGETGAVKLSWIGAHTSFENLTHRDNETTQ